MAGIYHFNNISIWKQFTELMENCNKIESSTHYHNEKCFCSTHFYCLVLNIEVILRHMSLSSCEESPNNPVKLTRPDQAVMNFGLI